MVHNYVEIRYEITRRKLNALAPSHNCILIYWHTRTQTVNKDKALTTDYTDVYLAKGKRIMTDAGVDPG